MKKLKIIRIILSLIFLLLATTMFYGVAHGVELLSETYARIQPMLALLCFNLGVLAFWLMITFFFGRLYCSVMCPLGVFQDFVARLFNKFKPVRKYRYATPVKMVGYISLVVVCVSMLCGIAVIPAMLDPNSIYGRMVVSALNPDMGYFATMPHVMIFSGFLGISVSVLTFIGVFVPSIANGRLYCNTVCPVGAMLGLCSKRAVYHIEINPDKCTACGKCEDVCKASCLDLSHLTVDMSRCVLCFNCIRECSDNAISYTTERSRPMTPLMQRIKEKAIQRSATPAIDSMGKADKTMNSENKKNLK